MRAETDHKLIAVVGETASGKSELAMQIARHCKGEIVCADAWTVYAGFDIGSAKPSVAERSEIQHHVLDVADPAVGFSVAQFQRLANEAIADIWRRKKLPILVGGSGLYIDSVLYQYSFNSKSNRYQRDVLNTMSIAELQKLSDSLGLNTAGVDMKNKRRVIRLIETNGKQASRSALRSGACVIGLMPNREELEDRMKSRVQHMIQAGLMAEVTTLAGQYGWKAEAMKGIGYREWRGYFEGSTNLADTKEKIVRSTLQLAKKQRTWFRRNKDIRWFESSESAYNFVQAFLSGEPVSK